MKGADMCLFPDLLGEALQIYYATLKVACEFLMAISCMPPSNLGINFSMCYESVLLS